MKKTLMYFFLSGMLCAQSDSVAEYLANAERSFSAASERLGIKESFLAFLADDCVMFNPAPVNGKDLYKKRKSNSAHLSWHPSFVEVAASKDFGISTGPWEFRKTKNDTPVAYGHFFSVWKKQPDGTWKVAFDNGISYSREKKKSESEHSKLLPSKTNAADSERVRLELSDAEGQFIKSLKENGMILSYTMFASENVRIYREGHFPSQNKVEAIELIKDEERQKKFTPLMIQTASSGDLGFTYGIAVDVKNDSSSYIRVWRKEKDWKLAVDMLAPFKK